MYQDRNKTTRRDFIKTAVFAGGGTLCSPVLGALPSGYSEPELTKTLQQKAKDGRMPTRKLGNTGEKLTILGFGGFHLLERDPEKAERLLQFYLDAGGNFIETALGYGGGESERKIGRVMEKRRDECFLSTKTAARGRKEASAHIDRSLENLNTDYVDNLFMHNVSTEKELKRILSKGGALKAAEKAREQGKIRFIGITSHDPHVLLNAIKTYPFDLVMEWINYYDYFNFPIIYDQILPECRARGMGIIAMKPVADGLLYRPTSAERGFRWVWSQAGLTSASAGNNTMYQLASNLALAKTHETMQEEEKEQLYHDAPELSRYVCRRCGECMPNQAGLDIPRIFELEGYFDRQMRPGPVMDLPDKRLRKKLSHWFGNEDLAKKAYTSLERKVTSDTDCSDVESKCPYNLPITAKLKWVHKKLTGGT